MQGKNFLTVAILSAVLTFGICGTSSAAEIPNSLSTSQSLEFSSHHHHHRDPSYDHHDRYDDHGCHDRTGYRNDRNQQQGNNRVNINVNVVRRV